MTDDIIPQLKKIGIFSGLSDEALTTIAERANTRKLAQGDVLMKKGDPGDSLFLVHSGSVKITTVNTKGEELILNKWGAGTALGEMALLDGGVRSASAIALEETEVLELSRETFEEIIKSPAVSLAIIKDSTKRLRFATTYIEKAIDLAQKIAAGDYSFLEQSEAIADGNDDSKAGQMLSAFFMMVRKVKEREDTLRKQLEKLTFEIDQTRRKQEFEEITGTEFYANLKEQARTLRVKRSQK
jgi:CRP-like cAMP-binding protein